MCKRTPALTDESILQRKEADIKELRRGAEGLLQLPGVVTLTLPFGTAVAAKVLKVYRAKGDKVQQKDPVADVGVLDPSDNSKIAAKYKLTIPFYDEGKVTEVLASEGQVFGYGPGSKDLILIDRYRT